MWPTYAMMAYGLGTVSWLILMLRQLPCQAQSINRYGLMCYSDIIALNSSRGQNAGAIPYVTMNFEYPALTGLFATVANWLAGVFGAHLTANASAAQLAANTRAYFLVNALMLFGTWMWLIASTLRLAPRRPQLALLLAVAPAVMTTGLINWDLLTVALTAAGLLAWVRGRPVAAGVWWGLGVAAKLYPVVLFGALLVWCLRSGRLRAWALAFAGGAVAWLVVNVPYALTNRTGWAWFYTANATRGADLGSPWYAIQLVVRGFTNPQAWSRVVMVVGYLALAGLILLAPRLPNVMQIAYLAVAIMTLGNLVYSPQYVLWLAALLVLVRPYAVDLVAFGVAELVYYGAVWYYLAGTISGSPPWLYVGAIALRLAVNVVIVARIVRDIWRGAAPADRRWLTPTVLAGVPPTAPTPAGAR